MLLRQTRTFTGMPRPTWPLDSRLRGNDSWRDWLHVFAGMTVGERIPVYTGMT